MAKTFLLKLIKPAFLEKAVAKTFLLKLIKTAFLEKMMVKL